MATHGPAYGFSAEVAKKLASSYDHNLERNISQWISSVSGERQSGSFAEWLKSGVVLCNLANKILPGSATGFKQSSMPFVQMENINRALEAFRRIGVQDTEMFMTVDLFEAKNMTAVLLTLSALDRAAGKRGFSGARLSTAGSAPPQVPLATQAPASVSVSAAFRPEPLSRPAAAPAAGGAAPRFCSGCGTAWAGGRFCSNCGASA